MEACNSIQKETPAQVFFCEFHKDFQNAYFVERLRTTAGVIERFTWTYLYFPFVLPFSRKVIISTGCFLVKFGTTKYAENITFSFKMCKYKLNKLKIINTNAKDETVNDKVQWIMVTP